MRILLRLVALYVKFNVNKCDVGRDYKIDICWFSTKRAA